MRALLLAGVALAAVSGSAQAAFVAAGASLFSPLPPVGATTTVVGVQGVSAPSQATLNGPGYSITFSGVGANQGIVMGSIPSTIHATPVAGVSGTTPLYLSGDFGSALTTNANAGNYLSTALGTITITFTSPQTSLALLWGSIDASNSVTFYDGPGGVAGDVLTGTAVQALATGFGSNGFQGPTGSAYVAVVTPAPFTKIVLGSGVVSFEVDGIVGSTAPFSAPEPMSLAVLGAGLLGLGLARRRNV